jgi:nucleotide-binding universal stress UspA family protein
MARAGLDAAQIRLRPAAKNECMNILLAVDGSEYSRKTASWLAANVSLLSMKPKITVLNAHAPIPVGAAPAVGKKAVERYYREECEAALAPSRAVLERAGVEHEVAWEVGEPAKAIVDAAGKHKANLIVMGSHGEGSLAGLLLGSVVTKVLARCKVPVLVVR